MIEPSGVYQMAEAAILRMRPKMAPIDRKTEIVRLKRFRRDLEAELADLDDELDAKYEQLTIERAAKHPALYAERCGKWREIETYYRKVADIIAEIDRRIDEDMEVIVEQEVQEPRQEVREAPTTQRQLFAGVGSSW